MAKMLLSWTNHVDRAAASLSASNQAGDLSPSNLADPIMGRRWRTTSLTAWVQLDAGANVDFHVLALAFNRDVTFPTAGTITHAIDADGGTPGAGAVYSSGAVAINTTDGYGYHFHLPSAAQTGRYWRATFNVSGVTFIDVGRMWGGGEAFRPTFNIAGGYDDAWVDLSRVSVAARTGAEYVDSRPRQRQLAFGLDAISASERTTLREMNRLTGNSSQVLFCVDTDNPDVETVIGRWQTTTSIRHRALAQALYRQAFQLRESI